MDFTIEHAEDSMRKRQGDVALILVIIPLLIIVIMMKIIPFVVILSNDNCHSYSTYIHP
jgi:hypothetical protein